jgi:tetratricopeptide (TPR) repeat protein
MYGGDLRGALLEFNGALQANPRSIEALFQRGNVQFRLGDPAAAIADYTRALELSPDHYEVLVARGHALMKQGDTKRAAADFGMARAIEEAIEKK